LFLGEPPRTQFDLSFSLFGLPIRVTPFFWVVGFALGYNAFAAEPVWLLMWIGALFVSILIHEMGHSFAFRRFGIDSHIVLYHFGGLAIPSSTLSSSSGFSTGGSLSPKQHIFVSAAGPGVQLIMAGMIYAAVRLSSYSLPIGLPFVPAEFFWGDLPSIPDTNLREALYIMMQINLYWALVNLLPVYPLDGGQIARELFNMSNPHAGIKNSLILSIATCAAVAIYAISIKQTYLTVMFGVLGFTSFQALQAYTGGGGGFGGWRGGRGGGGGSGW
jgi:stage IV sporulation protein FB